MARLRFKNYLFSEKIFVIFVYFFLFVFGVICIFPFINVLARSFSPEFYIQQGQVWLWPVKTTINTYVKIFQARGIISGFKNSFFVATVGTVINLFMSFMIAYPLSRKRLPLRSVFTLIAVFTMLFPVGIIPFYILVKKLGLINSLWALIIPYAIITFNMIIIKNYFQTIPDSLEESAFIDGAGELTILFRIFIPLSKPVIAAIGLFYIIWNWNIFMPAVFFITHPSKYTIQVVLRDILTQHMLEDTLPFEQSAMMTEAGPEGIQAAVTIVAMIPIMAIYPFIQKYFTRGIMIGSIKG
ncbi:MAG: carbohydrate ABC transporter permease [Spirochaetaceae bacterium]|nr:MAG: carbohydrate ABC transporter permease [Spirochaetaceae bacterium]